MYVKNPDSFVAFQNVLYNSRSRFFENLTLCGDDTLSDLNRVLINVHTSTIVGYPSYIHFHNYSALDVPYRAVLTDSETGARVGDSFFRFTAKANTSYSIPMSDVQSQIGWVPNSSQFHANFIFDTQSTTDTYRAVLGSLIYNEQLQAFVNMTQVCSVNH